MIIEEYTRPPVRGANYWATKPFDEEVDELAALASSLGKNTSTLTRGRRGPVDSLDRVYHNAETSFASNPELSNLDHSKSDLSLNRTKSEDERTTACQSENSSHFCFNDVASNTPSNHDLKQSTSGVGLSALEGPDSCNNFSSLACEDGHADGGREVDEISDIEDMQTSPRYPEDLLIHDDETDLCAVKRVKKDVFWTRVQNQQERADSLVREVLAQVLLSSHFLGPNSLSKLQKSSLWSQFSTASAFPFRGNNESAGGAVGGGAGVSGTSFAAAAGAAHLSSIISTESGELPIVQVMIFTIIAIYNATQFSLTFF